jgi:hypothetical protein
VLVAARYGHRETSIARHVRLPPCGRGKLIEIGVEARVLDFGIFPTVELADALLDRDAQFVELERFRGAALLRGADGARIASLASLALRYSPSPARRR